MGEFTRMWDFLRGSTFYMSCEENYRSGVKGIHKPDIVRLAIVN